MDWPIATVLLGTLGTLAVGILKWMPAKSDLASGSVYARATDMSEIRARLANLERAHLETRAELRADIKETQQMIQRMLSS